MLGFTGGGSIAANCGGGGSSMSPTASSATSSTCAVTLEGDIGPYFTDETSTQTGVPLALTLFFAGVYSNESSESTTGEQWLRGYQLTDSNGSVTFTTIVPGWYAGRTTHIHLRVRSTYSEASSTDGTNTTQLFFSNSDRCA